ncbi:sulfate transporter family-domain-containing protein [Schizophyllum fasciatum]
MSTASDFDGTPDSAPKASPAPGIASATATAMDVASNGESRQQATTPPQDINTRRPSIVIQRGTESTSASVGSRAGLLHTRFNNHNGSPASSLSLSSSLARAAPHSQDSIRASTVQLSNMLMPSPRHDSPRQNYVFPMIAPDEVSIPEQPLDEAPSMASSILDDVSSTRSSEGTPLQASGLTLLRPSTPPVEVVRDDRLSPTPNDAGSPGSPTPVASPLGHLKTLPPDPLPTPARDADERTPLLVVTPPPTGDVSNAPPSKGPAPLDCLRKSIRRTLTPEAVTNVAAQGVKALPAVLLGTLLNILDAVSYGILVFPTSEPFISLGITSAGVSMFFITAVVSQLVYTLGGSSFKGGNGSMMIEVVPFFHILSSSITADIGLESGNERAIAATTLAAYALSSILTGLSFLLLGFFQLGNVMGFFPRHILVGCIGGIGVFLIITGLCVSTGLEDTDFTYTLDTLKFFLFSGRNLLMWALPFGLAAVLRLVTTFATFSERAGQLIFPGYFVLIPAIFYVVVLSAKLDLGELRDAGWLFDVGGGEGKWYTFYEFFDFRQIRWDALWATLPTQFALLFFNILHPPLNVPALAVSLNEDVDTNKELTAHGYSNVLAGLLGVPPNYLVYVNTLLFYRVGGTTRISGLLLAGATLLLLFVGTGPIAYLPIMEVGALIFVLGIDLVKEALWDTRHRTSRTEYITIVSIMICMTVWDFVVGVLFGIVVSCFFFVVQNSQRRSIRSVHTGETVMSTVRRPSSQRAYIREVSKQTAIMRLQGFLFFGTITYVEETIKQLLDGQKWQRSPIRFLILDFGLVAGVDMSAAEAFVRIQRMLGARGVTLVLCGLAVDSPVGRALESVELFNSAGVEVFSTFNDALEWTENMYLRTWFRSQKAETSALMLPGRQDGDIVAVEHLGSMVGSPRYSHIQDVGNRILSAEHQIATDASSAQGEPLDTLVKAFSSYSKLDPKRLQPITHYLERMRLPMGHVLWQQDDEPDGLYIIESGILRAIYHFSDPTRSIEESMVPGTLAGELSALSGLPRNATTVVEQPAVVWRLSIESMRRMEKEHPELARDFLGLVLKSAKVDYDILLSALATRT